MNDPRLAPCPLLHSAPSYQRFDSVRHSPIIKKIKRSILCQGPSNTLVYNRLGTMAEFGERPTQGTEQGDGQDMTTVNRQLKTLTELMLEMQTNQAALQRQVVEMSTVRELGDVENEDALDNVGSQGRRSAGVRRNR